MFGHSTWGPFCGTIVMCAIFAAALPVAWPIGVGLGLLAGTIHAVMYVFVLSPSINGLCHFAGYKNFDNTATNIRALALITGGEGLHNNHHSFPRSPEVQFPGQRIRPRLAGHQTADQAQARPTVQDDRTDTVLVPVS